MIITNKRPFEIIQRRLAAAINVASYIYMFNAPESEWALIEGMQIICPEMVVFYDNINFTDNWFAIVNGIRIYPVLNGNPLANTGAKAAQRVPTVEILPVEGFGYQINNRHTTIIEVHQRQEFGFEIIPTVPLFTNPVNLVARIWGNYVTMEQGQGTQTTDAQPANVFPDFKQKKHGDIIITRGDKV